MLDHDTDSYHKISRAFVDGEPVGNLTRDHILDNITLYWLTRTGASAARSYWEVGRCAGRIPCERPGSAAGLGPGRLHDVPRRDLRCPAQLGRDGLPRPRLLQRGRQGRPLRRLGGARALRHRGAGRIPLTALGAARDTTRSGSRCGPCESPWPERPGTSGRSPSPPWSGPDTTSCASAAHSAWTCHRRRPRRRPDRRRGRHRRHELRGGRPGRGSGVLRHRHAEPARRRGAGRCPSPRAALDRRGRSR